MTAKSLLLGDDLLVCVLGGVFTDVEKALIELQKSTVVQETRSDFQQAMQHRSSPRSSASPSAPSWPFMSNSHVGPDLEIEIFILAAPNAVTGPDPDLRAHRNG